MCKIIKMPGCLRVAIPPRFNSVEDARLKRPRLFDYTLRCDTSVLPNLWSAEGNVYMGGGIVYYISYGYSKVGAISHFLSKTPKMHVVQ
jgi:hypothetical protein